MEQIRIDELETSIAEWEYSYNGYEYMASPVSIGVEVINIDLDNGIAYADITITTEDEQRMLFDCEYRLETLN